MEISVSRKKVDKAMKIAKKIKPLTLNQEIVFESDKHLVLHGLAGTGKTFISIFLAMEDIVDYGTKDELIIIRSAVSTRDIGYLPGTEQQKVSVYEEPYKDIINYMFDRGDAYEIFKTKQIVKFLTTSFVRGITLRNAVVLIDECQNMAAHELDSLLTRIGNNCRVILCGDYRQSDLKDNGLYYTFQVLEQMEEFHFIEFTVEDIVRSGFVKKYILAKNRIDDVYDERSSTGLDKGKQKIGINSINRDNSRAWSG